MRLRRGAVDDDGMGGNVGGSAADRSPARGDLDGSLLKTTTPVLGTERGVRGEAAKEAEELQGAAAKTTSFLAGGLAAGLFVLVGLGVVFKDPLAVALGNFMVVVEGLGPRGYILFALVYTLLEVLAVPAAPLTMTAGALFGVPLGAALVLTSATAAACVSFMVTRYLARDRVMALAEKIGNGKWKAVDAAIGRDGFRVVLLLRLSPLLPFALSNYLYGLTSVPLNEYAAGSFLGMIPGTVAYVAAGTVGKKLLLNAEGRHESPSLSYAKPRQAQSANAHLSAARQARASVDRYSSLLPLPPAFLSPSLCLSLSWNQPASYTRVTCMRTKNTIA